MGDAESLLLREVACTEDVSCEVVISGASDESATASSSCCRPTPHLPQLMWSDLGDKIR